MGLCVCVCVCVCVIYLLILSSKVSPNVCTVKPLCIVSEWTMERKHRMQEKYYVCQKHKKLNSKNFTFCT